MSSATTRQPPHHDKLTCYTDYRCRLPECVARARDYEQQLRGAHADGTWQNLVDARPVREHLQLLLAADCTVFSVATAAGLPDVTVRGFVEQRRYGGQRVGIRRRTSPETAAAILAVTPEDAKGARLSTVGSRRRIEALVAAGWPLLHISNRSGLSYTTLADIRRKATIYATTAERLATAYDALKRRQPTKYGVSRLQARKARERAVAERWPRPAYWDDDAHPIDDDAFEPEYGVTPAQIIAEEARFLMEVGGLNLAAAAKRLNRSRGYIEEALADFPAVPAPAVAA